MFDPPRDRDQLAAIQLERLNSLVDRVIGANPFQSPRLAAFAAGPRTLDSLRALVPLTCKADLVRDQAENPPFGTNLTFPVSAYTRYNQTSGTSGEPLRWLDTPESWAWMVKNWEAVFLAADATADDRVFFAFSFGPFLGFWTAFDAAENLGCLCIPGGGQSTSARLQSILQNRVTVVCCTPTYALRLGETAAEEGIDLGRSAVRALLLAGEPGASVPETRQRVELLWPRARVFDHHGMTEVGPVSYECPKVNGLLHILEESFIPEVISPSTLSTMSTASTMSPHSIHGELILTNLGRVGSPLFRYRTGDLVCTDGRAPDEPCACGSVEIGLRGGILGRTDDMLVIRGVNVHPSAVEAIVRRFAEIAEFRVNVRPVRSLLELAVEIEPVPNCSSGERLAEKLEGALREALNLRIPVASVPPGALPRFEMKAKRWIYHQAGSA